MFAGDGETVARLKHPVGSQDRFDEIRRQIGVGNEGDAPALGTGSFDGRKRGRDSPQCLVLEREFAGHCGSGVARTDARSQRPVNGGESAFAALRV